jgi:hypothetical protein
VKVLLDECLPRKLMHHISGHEVTTVVLAGWSGKKNGELLRLAATRFEVFVTADRNLSFQQVVTSLPIAVVVLVAPTNRFVDLVTLVPAVQTVLGEVKAGEVRHVGNMSP